jgi:hypothetical protein
MIKEDQNHEGGGRLADPSAGSGSPRTHLDPARAFFYVLLFGYPVLSFLWRREYPVFTVEVMLLMTALVLLALVFSLAQGRMGRLVSAAVTTMLVLLCLMVQFNLRLEGLALIILLFLPVALVLGERFHALGIPVLLAVLLGAYLDSRNLAAPPDASAAVTQSGGPPAIVHILLDGFVAPGGLPDYPASEVMSAELDSFFRNHDLTVFPRAYSRYRHTGDSIYSAFNFSHEDWTIFNHEISSRKEHWLRENAFWNALERLGYRFDVVQAGYMDYCRSNPGSMESCWQYQQPNVLAIRAVESPIERARMLASVLINQSTLAIDLLGVNALITKMALPYHDPRALERLAGNIADKGAGRVYFAHVLLPHGPYGYDENCRVRLAGDYQLKWARMSGEPPQPSIAYEFRYGYYFAQMECALKSLSTLFRQMKRAGMFDDSIIILHGDHGSGIVSRKPEHQNAELFTLEEYRSAFSTLFAVRFPGGRYSMDERALPLATLLESTSRAIEQAVSGVANASDARLEIPGDPVKTDAYVYLTGISPYLRVQIDIFADRPAE